MFYQIDIAAFLGGNYNDQWKCVEEREGTSTDASRQYVWGARPNHRDELILRDRDTDGNGTLDERLYCLMDYFDPTAMVDTSGSVVERYAFTPFGKRTVMDADWTVLVASRIDIVLFYQIDIVAFWRGLPRCHRTLHPFSS